MNNQESADLLLRRLHEQGTPSREAAQAALSALAATLGMDALTLDEQGAAELVIQEKLRLSLTWGEGQPGLIAAAAMPDELASDPLALSAALQANGSWSVTQGAAFLVIPGTGKLALCRHILLPSPEAGDVGRVLADELAAFSSLALSWVQFLGELSAADVGKPPAAPENELPPGSVRV